MSGLLRLLLAPATRNLLQPSWFTFADTMQRAASSGSQDDVRREVNKAMYRAKQRGLLELDLVMGIYAERNVPTMSSEQLAETERLLREENVDLWQWITQQSEAPEHVQQNPVFQACSLHMPSGSRQVTGPGSRAADGCVSMQELSQSVQEIYATKCPRQARASPDAQWVHGWQDKPNTTV